MKCVNGELIFAGMCDDRVNQIINMHEWSNNRMNGQFEFGDVSANRYFLAIASVLGLAFAFIAVEETSMIQSLVGVLQWQLQTVIPVLILIGIHHFSPFIRITKKSNPWVQLAISGALGALLFSPLALILDWWIEGPDPAHSSIWSSWLQELWGVGPPIVICWMAMNAPWVLGWTVSRNTSPNSVSDKSDQPTFMKLMPPMMRGEIVTLQSEKHHLWVTTINGKAKILCALNAAIAQLPEDAGIQPHRSYWVNPQHILYFRRNGREGVLVMRNNTEIPVSRAHIAEFQEKWG